MFKNFFKSKQERPESTYVQPKDQEKLDNNKKNGLEAYDLIQSAKSGAPVFVDVMYQTLYLSSKQYGDPYCVGEICIGSSFLISGNRRGVSLYKKTPKEQDVYKLAESNLNGGGYYHTNFFLESSNYDDFLKYISLEIKALKVSEPYKPQFNSRYLLFKSYIGIDTNETVKYIMLLSERDWIEFGHCGVDKNEVFIKTYYSKNPESDFYQAYRFGSERVQGITRDEYMTAFDEYANLILEPIKQAVQP